MARGANERAGLQTHNSHMPAPLRSDPNCGVPQLRHVAKRYRQGLGLGWLEKRARVRAGLRKNYFLSDYICQL